MIHRRARLEIKEQIFVFVGSKIDPTRQELGESGSAPASTLSSSIGLGHSSALSSRQWEQISRK